MSEDHKKLLKQQLWNIANTLRGKMDADEFRDYIFFLQIPYFTSLQLKISGLAYLARKDNLFNVLETEL